MAASSNNRLWRDGDMSKIQPYLRHERTCVRVGPSRVHGLGLFAVRDFADGDDVCVCIRVCVCQCALRLIGAGTMENKIYELQASPQPITRSYGHRVGVMAIVLWLWPSRSSYGHRLVVMAIA